MFQKHKYCETICVIGRKRSAMSVKRVSAAAEAIRALGSSLASSPAEAPFYAALNDIFAAYPSDGVSFSKLMSALDSSFESIENHESAVSMLLVSILSILSRFRTARRRYEFCEATQQLVIDVDVKRIWIAILWQRSQRNPIESREDLRALLIAMAILLINSRINEKFHKIADFGSKVWAFGNEYAKISSRRRESSVSLRIRVHACTELLSALKDIADGNPFSGNVNYASEPSIEIHIKCKDASLWGCQQDILIRAYACLPFYFVSLCVAY